MKRTKISVEVGYLPYVHRFCRSIRREKMESCNETPFVRSQSRLVILGMIRCGHVTYPRDSGATHLGMYWVELISNNFFLYFASTCSPFMTTLFEQVRVLIQYLKPSRYTKAKFSPIAASALNHGRFLPLSSRWLIIDMSKLTI